MIKEIVVVQILKNLINKVTIQKTYMKEPLAFGKKIIEIRVTNKLKRSGFHCTDCYISGDLSLAISYDAIQKKVAFNKILGDEIYFYILSDIQRCEIEIFIEGPHKRKISIPNTLLGAVTGRLIGGKNAAAILAGAAIGASASSHFLDKGDSISIKQLFLYVVTNNNTFRINYKPILDPKPTDHSVYTAIYWNRLINSLI